MRRTRIAAATVMATAGLIGAGASSANALTVTLVTGQNSPKGTNTVVAPDAATPGALNAFTNVVTKGPGDLSNIDLVPTP